MNNIKEKIKELFQEHWLTMQYRPSCLDVFKVIEQEEQNNIFLKVPRKVKLSEIVEKLSPHYYKYLKIFYNSEINAIGFKELTSNYFIRIVEFDNSKISLVYSYIDDNNKWLYAMWLAGTEIEVDL